MYLAKLSFNADTASPADVAAPPLDTLLRRLRMNGQICGREYPMIRSAKGYETFMLIPEADALESNHFNQYIQQSLAEFQVLGFTTPQLLLLGEDIESADVCTCTHVSAYILYTTYVSLESPLRCGDCFLPVPLYRIPHTYEDGGYDDIVSWQSDYQSCDRLQMNCSILERAATREISRLDSHLSQRGREICSHISALTQRPTYYYLYRDKARSRAQELKRRCPSCGNPWLVTPPWHLFDFKCDTCCLISNIAWNVSTISKNLRHPAYPPGEAG